MSYVDDLLHEIIDDDSSSQVSAEDIWWNSPNNNNNGFNNTSSSTTTTIDDRSSINSLPWAEDAIKHNQDEWERIQSIFFGEQPIEKTINDKRLANEFKEWMNKFPHLRIIGISCPIYYSNKNVSEYDEGSKNEEIFAIHPISSTTTTTTSNKDNHWNDNKRLKHPINNNKHGILYSKDYNNEFFIRESSSAFHRNNNLNPAYKNETKLNNNNNNNSLHITSGGRSLLLPSSARPIILHRPKNDYLQYSLSPSSSSVIKSAYNSNQITSSLNENYLLKVPLHMTSIIPQRNTMHLSPYSSISSSTSSSVPSKSWASTVNNNYLKIPPIYTESNNLQPKTMIDKRKQLKNSVTLPSINVNALPTIGPASPFSSSIQFGKELFQNEIITGRSISALYQRNNTTNNNNNNNYYNHQKTDLLLPINKLNYRPSTITKSRNKSE